MDKAVPKYWKEKYDVFDFESYKDVPGWVNDAEFIYEEMVNQAEDGDHFVEIGVLLGQSTTRMGELIRDSKKKIRFDAIDIFWIIEHTIRNYKLSGHTKEFFNYIDKNWKGDHEEVDVHKSYKIDGRRTNFREKMRKLGYIKSKY